jgi:hypothetical protein
MLFRLTAGGNEQPVRLAETDTDNGRFAVTEMEYDPVALDKAVSCELPESWTFAPASATFPGPVTRPEIDTVPVRADAVFAGSPPVEVALSQLAATSNSGSVSNPNNIPPGFARMFIMTTAPFRSGTSAPPETQEAS